MTIDERIETLEKNFDELSKALEKAEKPESRNKKHGNGKSASDNRD